MEINQIRKEFRKFRTEDFYDDSLNSQFRLLPFNFKRLDSGKELLINMVGDFIIAPNGSVSQILKKNSSIINTDLYYDLLSNNFIHESEDVKSLELLANRLRTKKSNAFKFARLHAFVITLRCEHTCQYCQVSRVSSNKEKYDFSKSNLYKAINLMLSSPEKYLTMEFQGGEALLAFDLIKEAIE